MHRQSVIDTVTRLVNEELPPGYRLKNVDLGFGPIYPGAPATFQARIFVVRNRPPADPSGWGKRVAERIREIWSAESLGISVLELPEGMDPPPLP